MHWPSVLAFCSGLLCWRMLWIDMAQARDPPTVGLFLALSIHPADFLALHWLFFSLGPLPVDLPPLLPFIPPFPSTPIPYTHFLRPFPTSNLPPFLTLSYLHPVHRLSNFFHPHTSVVFHRSRISTALAPPLIFLLRFLFFLLTPTQPMAPCRSIDLGVKRPSTNHTTTP